VTTSLEMFMCLKLTSLFVKEMEVYYVTNVFKQGFNIKRCVLTTYSNLETRTRIYYKAQRPT